MEANQQTKGEKMKRIFMYMYMLFHPSIYSLKRIKDGSELKIIKVLPEEGLMKVRVKSKKIITLYYEFYVSIKKGLHIETKATDKNTVALNEVYKKFGNKLIHYSTLSNYLYKK